MSHKLQAERLQGLEGGERPGTGDTPLTLRYSRNRIDAYDYVGASCFNSAEYTIGAHPALYRVYGFIRRPSTREAVILPVGLLNGLRLFPCASLPLSRSRFRSIGRTSHRIYREKL